MSEWRYVEGQDVEVGMALHRFGGAHDVIVAIAPYIGPFESDGCLSVAKFANGTGMTLWQGSPIPIANVS